MGKTESIKAEEAKKIFGNDIPTPEELTDWSWVKDHIKLDLRRAGTQSLKVIVCPYKDMEYSLRIPFGGHANVKVTKSLAEHWGVSHNEMFDHATNNTEAETIIRPLSEIMDEMMREMGFEVPDEEENCLPVVVVTNSDKYLGASGIMSHNVLRHVCEKLGTDHVMIIPSSIHEVLCAPADIMSEKDAMEMVKAVNVAQVPEEDRLSDTPWYFNNNNCIG